MYSKIFQFLYFLLLLKTVCLEAIENSSMSSVPQTSTPCNNSATEVKELQDSLRKANQQIGELEELSQLPETPNSSQLCDTVPRNCKEIHQKGYNLSDFYIIQPKFTARHFVVFCEMNLTGGGWISILNRFDGSEDFHLGWDDYKEGFGNMAGEFWLGLENIYHLTGSEINELLIELVDWNKKKFYAHYNSFSIGSESEGYSIKLLNGYNGDAGDGFSYHAGMKFSTKDKDNDRSTINCAATYHGAWWYKSCMKVHLTGKYLGKKRSAQNISKGMYYQTPRRVRYHLKEARMMIRPRENTDWSLIPDESSIPDDIIEGTDTVF